MKRVLKDSKMIKNNLTYFEGNMTEVEKLKKQLEIAIKVLKHYENKKLCIKALEEINKIEKESK